ncbi:MAG: hypothetical protein SW833_19380 [Cyanobacteriota bacterium]|nr:hypothetical protein [Cyanobacteriota bacterium]
MAQDINVHIKGYREIIQVFLVTRPKIDNIEEWKKIKEDIIKYEDKPDVEAFQRFVQTLTQIKPERDNKEEWSAIRSTCEDILHDWETTEKQPLFRKLLSRFVSTVPRQSNKDEWNKIRKESESILRDI